MNRTRLIAIGITVATALVVVILLLMCRLVFDPSTLRQPPRPMTELVELDEEFVELLDQATVKSDPAPAYAENKAKNDSPCCRGFGQRPC